MNPQAITFDFWRTLFRDARSEERQELRIHAFMRLTGVSEAETRDVFTVWPAEFARVHIEEQRTLTPQDAVRMACDALGLDLSLEKREELAETFATAILEYPAEPIDGALEAVRAAAARRPVGIISDTAISPGRCLRVLLDRHGFSPYLRATTFSDEVGVSKPRAPMFQRTADALGVAVNSLLHIGDLEPTDVSGIHSVGGVAALYGGDNAKFVGNTRAEFTFVSWNEFIERLPAIAP